MALPLTPSQKDVFEDKLAEAEAQIELIRLLATNLQSNSGNSTAIDTAVTAAKAAIDAAKAQKDA